ncbi:two-component sensor histidine kinase [Streptomyces sp. PLM4]|uniref:histidine kinase n=3 Tax=Streptomyces TaxID=1883 RepID=A0AA37BXH5_9ACTN|nr:two-component sensor histidine kinase [Streptomyces sp. PLM4]GHI46527.1 two-component sensor histidine kinase [Streptomyces albidoflavus]
MRTLAPMRTDMTRDSNRRATVCALVTCLVVLPAFVAPLEALFVVIPTAVAVVASMARYPLGGLTLPRAVAATSALSVLGDLGFLLTSDGWAEVKWALPWLPFELTALLVLLLRVVRRAPVLPAAALGTLTAAAAVVLPLRFSLKNSHSVLEQSVLGVLAAAVLALAAAGIGLHQRAQDERRAEAINRARRDQRLQVARDLHDFVAHEVTGILLETQAARLVDYDEAGTRELLERLEAAGQRALSSMDDTLRVLREPGTRTEPPATRVHGLDDLAGLLGRFEGSGSVRTALDLPPGLAGTLPRETEDAAYRLVIEALTNIRRHAPDARLVTVAVDRDAHGLRVAVSDDGGRPTGPAPAPRADGGTGLVALTERFTGLRGSLEAGPGPAGWTVIGVLPLDTP